MDALLTHRLHFAFTIAFHYLWPQLTMGLALLIFVLKTRGLRGDVRSNEAARFWTKIFGLAFVMGVVTGIPLEFQFGTNWSRFSRAAGGVVAQTLAMEGVFAFFLESACLWLLLYGEKRIGPRLHWLSSLAMFLGTWLSGYFIVCTNAFMQHPVGYEAMPDGTLRLASLGAYLTNGWALVQYAHTMIGSVITASFVMAGIGAYYVLLGRHREHATVFLRTGVVAGTIASVAAAFPSGDMQARLVADGQPATFAAMEGHFHTEDGAAMVLVGQPNMETLTLDNAIVVPNVLSFLTYKRWSARIRGLVEFPESEWPDNIPLLYYSYHIMVGLGTIFIALMSLAAFMLFRKRLTEARPVLWMLMLAMPFPYIANTAGWMTSELGRQPWLVHGLMRTADGYSDNVSAGNALFSLLGFMGLYALLAMLSFSLVLRIVGRGPEAA